MPSPLLNNVLLQIVQRLDQNGHLELTSGASLDDLHAELVRQLQAQPELVQLHAWLLGILVRSPHVEELFISDDELRELLRDLAP
jgi:hypothetical protein